MKDTGNELLKKGKADATYIELDLVDQCSESPIDLIAGQHTVVGQLLIETNTANECINITYKLDDEDEGDWYLTEVHLHLTTDPNEIPMNRAGNPMIGHFEYNFPLDIDDQVKEFELPVCIPIPEDENGNPVNSVFIAAHGVACNKVAVLHETPDFEQFCASLPETADLTVVDDRVLGYFTSTITDGGWLDGEYPGWCLSRIITIPRGVLLDDFEIVCSLDPNLEAYGIVDYPENMPLVNYILNQNYIGKIVDVESADKKIRAMDVQCAIWELIDESGAPEVYMNDKVQWILEDVEANSPDFVLECGSYVGIILVPPRNEDGSLTTQVSMISVPLSCESYEYECETIWAEGFEFPGNNWAMFFKYCTD